MNQQKYTFYQPSQAEQSERNLLSQLQSQQSHIKELLSKYREVGPNLQQEQAEKHISQIKYDKQKESTSLQQKNKLPAIRSSRKSTFNIGRKKQQLNHVYGKVMSKNKSIKGNPREKRSISLLEKTFSMSHQQPDKSSHIPDPISITLLPKNKQEKEEQVSSDEENAVSLMSIQRELGLKIIEQCKEETNYLYFSAKNEVRTQNTQVMKIFQHHDFELREFNRKHKILEKFDGHYFWSWCIKK